jgi:hypothetical protein
MLRPTCQVDSGRLDAGKVDGTVDESRPDGRMIENEVKGHLPGGRGVRCTHRRRDLHVEKVVGFEGNSP